MHTASTAGTLDDLKDWLKRRNKREDRRGNSGEEEETRDSCGDNCDTNKTRRRDTRNLHMKRTNHDKTPQPPPERRGQRSARWMRGMHML
jgi:hypothetical protein